MSKATINGITNDFVDGISILEAAKSLGIEIPTLCHIENLEAFGSCGICVVEIKNQNKVVPACATKLLEGMDIETHNDSILSTRKMLLELLFSDHLGDCVPPCSLKGCPANINIQGFLDLESKGKYNEAAALIREKAPLPNILGRICPKPCEKVCLRNRVDEPVMIGVQKRYIAEKEWSSGGPFFPHRAKSSHKRVAIIGAGPAGITAAYYLSLNGHSVVIYEKQAKLGGMMRFGIPKYRLPEDVIDTELNAIVDKLNIDVSYNVEVGKDIDVEEIISKFDAVVFSHGSQLSNKMNVDGEHHEKVIKAVDFLYKLAINIDVNLGKDVVIIGGGHTAMDAARSAARLGSNVTLMYRRSEKEMPAKDEIKEAKDEGVVFEFLVAPERIKRKGGKLYLHCIRMILGEPDESGRRKPIPNSNSRFVLEVDNIISAVGQFTDNSWLPSSWLSEKGHLQVNPSTYQIQNSSGHNNIFAMGDAVTGPDLVVTAVAAGRKVAASVNQLFLGSAVTGEEPVYASTCGELNDLPQEMFSKAKKIARANIPLIDKDIRLTSFNQIEESLNEEEFREESLRCLKCGCVAQNDCKLREYGYNYKADTKKFAGEKRKYEKDFSHLDIKLEIDKCISCGSCVRVCESIKKYYIFGYINRGFTSKIKPEFNRRLIDTKCDACGKCCEVCPTAGVWKHG